MHFSRSFLRGAFIFTLVMAMLTTFMPTPRVFAAGESIVLKQQLIGSVPSPIARGTSFKIRLTYECSGSTGTGCNNVVITAALPAGIDYVASTTDTNVQNFNYTAPNATWTMRQPLPLGTTGQFEITVQFTPGTPSNGLPVLIPTTATSTNATVTQPPPISVLTTPVTDQATISKSVSAAGTVDSDTIYSINACSGPAATAMNMTNVVVTDTLPPGATFVSASPSPSSTVGGVIVWPASNINVPGCKSYSVRVTFASPTNSIGQNKQNDAQMSYTPADGSASVNKTASENHNLPAPDPKMDGSKSTNLDYAIVGSTIINQLSIRNTGNADLYNPQFVDTIPDHFNVTSIDTGNAIAIDYQKNGVNTWITSVPIGTNVAVTIFPGFNVGDYVSALRFTTNKLGVTDGAGGVKIYSTVINPGHSGASGTMPLSIQNTMTMNANYHNNGVPTSIPVPTPVISTAPVDDPKPRPALSKSVSPSQITPDSDINYTAKLENRGYATLSAPVLVDLLSADVDYIVGSQSSSSTAVACGAPTFTATPNYFAGRTLLQWSWGAGCGLAAGDPDNNIAGQSISLQYKVHAKPSLAAGMKLPNRLTLSDYTPADIKATNCATSPDEAHFTGDPTKFCSSGSADVTILASVQIDSSKWVKGQLDAGFSRDPIVGQTVLGGNLTFAVVLTNTGNIPFNNLHVIDLLPFKDLTTSPPSNIGTRDSANLGTTWTPRLTGPIQVTPSIPGLLIYYSVDENPCRPDVVDTHPDAICIPMVIGTIPGPGVWSLNIPADPTTVRSVWFEFDPAYTLGAGEHMQFTFDMVAPIDAPLATAGTDATFGTNDDGNVAWNTFAYRVTRTDDNTDLVAQPPRVGIEVRDSLLASFGDYVWNDQNRDGTQNEGPEQGINGVTVKLYKSDGTLVGTQITTYDVSGPSGNPGYYRFGGLQPGDYYAEFTLPTNYTFSPANTTTDGIDSDGAIVVSPTVMRTATVTLGATDNFDYDQGLFSTAVSIGDRVWYDTNNNSQINAGEVGIPGVDVELFLDTNGDGKLTGAEQQPIAKDTTDALGFYLFTKQTLFNGTPLTTPLPLSAGQYIVGINKSNFGTGKPLIGYLSSGSYTLPGGVLISELDPFDPNDGNVLSNPGIDDDDNGMQFTPVFISTPFYKGGVLSKPVRVSTDEPLNEAAIASHPNETPGGLAIDDSSSNQTVDFGFYTQELGNIVWQDDDNSGTKDAGENGIGSIPVRLYEATGTYEFLVGPDGMLGTSDDVAGGITTKPDGSYLFQGLPAGRYVVKIDAPLGMISSLDLATTATPNSNKDEDTDENGIGIAGGTISSATDAPSMIVSAGNTTAPVTATNSDGKTSYPTMDFGLVPIYSIGNQVWLDTNNSGTLDGAEVGINGVTVELYAADGSGNPSGAVLQTATTANGGYYLFQTIYRGNYVVVIPSTNFSGALAGYSNSSASFGDDDINLNDNGRPGTAAFANAIVSSMITLGPGDSELDAETATPGYTDTTPDKRTNLTVDFGFYKLSVGNQLWYDINNDGIYQSATETTLPTGITLELYDNTSTLIASTQTNASGVYLFDRITVGANAGHGLPPGSYFIRIPASEFVAGKPLYGFHSSLGSTAAPAPNGNTDNDDNGAPNATAVESLAFDLTPGAEGPKPNKTVTESSGTTNDPTVDFGFHTMSIGNLVWNDLNNNGIKDGAETGINGLSVSLYADDNNDGIPDGAALTTQPTSNGGHYLFTGLTDGGKYLVEVTLTAGWVSSNGDGNTLLGASLYEPGIAESNLVADDNKDHGSQQATLLLRSQTITLGANSEPTGETDTTLPTGVTNSASDTNSQLTIDFGIYQPLSVGNLIWDDANNDGIYQSATESLIDGVTVNLWDANGSLIRTTTTANGGRYLFDILVDGNYVVELNKSNFQVGGILEGYVSSTGSPGNLTGPNEGGATPDPDTGGAAASDTDDNGTTQVDGSVRALPVTISAGSEPTTENPNNDPTAVNANSNLTVDFGVFQPASLGDYVWLDTNRDGKQDGSEAGINNVRVRLYDSTGTTQLAQVTTDITGYYHFPNLVPNTTYVLKLNRANDYISGGALFGTALTTQSAAGTTTADDSDATLVGGFPTISTATTGGPNTDTPTYDFGFYQVAALGDYVWHDANSDGIQDVTEVGINGVTVSLYTANGPDGIAGNSDDSTAVATMATITNAGKNGYYHFSNLYPNTTYTIALDNTNDYTSGPLKDYLLTIPLAPTATTTTDSNASVVGGFATIASATTGAAGSDTLTYDIGFFQPASLGDYVWHDANGDGIQNNGEQGIDGVTVSLYTAKGADGIAGNADDTLPVATTTGDNTATVSVETGYYHVGNLRPNTTYTVKLDNASDYTTGPLSGYILTIANQTIGATDLTDSDASMVGGFATIASTPTVGEGSDTPTYDFGFFQPASLGNRIWYDTNNNGLIDGTEAGIDGVSVSVYASNLSGTPTGAAIHSATTSGGGYYRFDNLPNGNYVVMVNASNFTGNSVLGGYHSSAGAVDPASNTTDQLDHGIDPTTPATNGVLSRMVTLGNSAPTGEIDKPSPDPIGDAIDTRSNLTVDFGFYRLTIGNQLWFDTNNDGIYQSATETTMPAGITVQLIGAGNSVVATTTTNASGIYLFDRDSSGNGLAPGDYLVKIPTIPTGYALSTTATSGVDNTNNGSLVGGSAMSSTFTMTPGSTAGGANVTTNATTDNSTLDFGFYKPIDLRLVKSASQITSATGSSYTTGDIVEYTLVIDNLGSGTVLAGYTVDDTLPTGLSYVPSSLIAPDFSPCDVTGQALSCTATGTLAPGAANKLTITYRATITATTAGTTLTNTAHVIPATGDVPELIPSTNNTDTHTITLGTAFYSLGNRIWYDTNNNGQIDGLEVGIDGVSVDVYAADASGNPTGAAIHSATTINGGYYRFDGLVAGNYVVVVDPSNFTGTHPLVGYTNSTGAVDPASNTTDQFDNGIDTTAPASNGILSGIVTLGPGNNAPTGESDLPSPNPSGAAIDARSNLTVDFGFYHLTIGDYVWFDDNGNSLFDGGELPASSGIVVQLIDAGNSVLATTTTDTNGKYLFDRDSIGNGLAPGNYRVRIPGNQSLLNGYYPSSIATSGTNNANNGALQSSNDVETAVFTMTPGSTAGGANVTNANATTDNPTLDFSFYKPIDLRMSKTIAPVAPATGAPYLTDDIVEYTLVIDNIGSAPALAGYMVEDTIPAGMSYVSGSLSATGFSPCDVTGQVLTCIATSPLAPNAAVTITYQAKISALNGSLTNAAQVTPAGSDVPELIPLTHSSTNNKDQKTITLGDLTFSLGNRVWFDTNNNGQIDGTETGIDGVSVSLYAAGAGGPTGAVIQNAVTAGGGYYRFDNLPAGDYVVVVNASNFDLGQVLDGYLGSNGVVIATSIDDSFDNGTADTSVGVGIASPTVTLGPGNSAPTFDSDAPSPNPGGESPNIRSDRTIDFGFYQLNLGNLIFDDLNGDGIFNGSDTPRSGLTVTLLDGSGNPTGRTTTTDMNGSYRFDKLLAGSYIVSIIPPTGFTSSPNVASGYGTSTNNTNHGVVHGSEIWSNPITLTPGDTAENNGGNTVANGATTNNQIDLGLVSGVSVGDRVWYDINGNGIQDVGEKNLAGVTVTLYAANGTTPITTDLFGHPIGPITTGASGAYLFSDLLPGQYTVVFTTPVGFPYKPTKVGATGSTPSNDSNGTTTKSAVLLSGQSDLTLDSGFWKPASLGSTVWFDADDNGQKEPTEHGIGGVIVTLYDASGTPIATTTTDANGGYGFTNLPPGTYTLGFTNLPGGYRFTNPNQGNDTSDSDVDPNTGRTGSVTLQPGDNNPTLWAGIYISPTAISLSSFTATREGQDVVIGWQTGAEQNTFGYRVLRSTTGNRADAIEVTSELLAAQGRGGDGASYRWIDPTAQVNQSYTYWLVEVEINGTTNEYGPARIIQPTGGNYTVVLPLIER